MSGFDWIIAVIFLISIVIGVMRGFIREALSIISWIVALWLASTYCQEAGNFLSQYINIPADVFRTSAGFALIFIVTLFAFSAISFIISKIVSRGAIKGIDRVLGLGFGAIRAVAVVVVVMLLARGIGMDKADWWANSNLLGYFEPIADYVEPLLPEELRASNEGDEAVPTPESAVDEKADSKAEITPSDSNPNGRD